MVLSQRDLNDRNQEEKSLKLFQEPEISIYGLASRECLTHVVVEEN